MNPFKSLINAVEYFSDDERCREYFASLRFENGIPQCHHCGNEGAWKIEGGKRYKCKACRKRFSLKTNSIFQDSNLSLKQIAIGIYLLTSSKKGISSRSLAKSIGCGQRAAWLLQTKIREMLIDEAPEFLAEEVTEDGEVVSIPKEIDEAYLLGSDKWRHKDKKRGKGDKPVCFGILNRGGEVYAKIVPDATNKSLTDVIADVVEKGSVIYSDESRAYLNLWQRGYNHQSVKHKSGQYVDGDCHTNGIENFWSHLKRGRKGTYISVSRKHLQRLRLKTAV